MSDVVVYPYRYPTAASIPTSGMVGWWDASDTSSITASGGAVSQWADQSGNSRHLTQATGSLRPTTGTRTINGRNVLDFTLDQLVTSALTLPQPVTVCAVVQSDNNTQQRWIFSTAATTLVFYTNSTWQLYSGTTFNTTVAADTSACVAVAQFSSTTSQIWINGISIGVGNAGTSGASSQALSVGGTGGPTEAWDGTIGEVVVYDRVLSDTERDQVGAYLATKWATPSPPPVSSGLARWFKADDAPTVVASVGSVSQWTDKAGGNDNLTQATGTARPRTGVRTINGRNALDFDGGDYLAAATSLAQPLTNFIVVQSDLATTAINRNIMGGSGNTFQLWAGSSLELVAYAAGFIQINSWLNTNVRLITNVANGVGSFMRVDGAGNVTGSMGDFGSNATHIGGHGGVGSWDGAIAEVIQYDRVLTGTEIGQVEAYLAGQWGITLP